MTASQDANPSVHNFVLSTVFSLFSSSGPAGDWLKFFIAGGILELLRRVLMFVWENLVTQFLITLELEECNDGYCEIAFIMSSDSEPNGPRLHSLDDGVVISTAHMDGGQGVVD